MNIIQANNIIRMFPTGAGEFYALKGVDVEIPQGKLTILKGRSGSGKTTLMNILSTLDVPTDGNVIFDGQDYRDITELEKEQLRMSILLCGWQKVIYHLTRLMQEFGKRLRS